jgi:hypothetical protein
MWGFAIFAALSGAKMGGAKPHVNPLDLNRGATTKPDTSQDVDEDTPVVFALSGLFEHEAGTVMELRSHEQLRELLP